ncbi:response regulator transcription factor [Rhodosalinus halophilus]|uniref:response regulator transcription factor n=1 Tax=Rhodosalinus halophilus TaxID=2259333 RepID=UPI0018F42A92|nr:response regulator transcription factor [Rhodosalinus halophilus]
MIPLLLLEDEARIASFVTRGLAAEGYDVTCVATGAEALAAGLSGEHAVIVLDVMVPDISGMEVCERLRAGGVSAPILMLTARDADEDIVEGLERGADDYLAKPFAFDVLLARLSALLRRGNGTVPGQPAESAVIGALTLDRGRRQARLNDNDLGLTRLEFDVLWLFVTNPDRVHSRERILSHAWGADADPLTNVVDVYMARLRKKLAQPDAPKLVTVRGVGYRLDAGYDREP